MEFCFATVIRSHCMDTIISQIRMYKRRTCVLKTVDSKDCEGVIRPLHYISSTLHWYASNPFVVVHSAAGTASSQSHYFDLRKIEASVEYDLQLFDRKTDRRHPTDIQA